MSLWEYKVITSGKGGFATPALLEKFLNDLGQEEWELVHFQPQADNPLAFSGLARRSTQREWTLENAAAAAARTEADKLRAEFEAKFKGAAGPAPAEEKPETVAGDKIAADDGLRRVRDTERDLDPEADDEEPKDEWDMLTAEDELPTFFEAIRPHMRRNQRGPGQSVGVEHLAKKWDLSETDLKGALVECGFVLPEDEDTPPVYLEYEGDLYWLNINRRGELWLNTKEKPRPVFRTVPGQRVGPEAAAAGGKPAEGGGQKLESAPEEPSAGRESKPAIPAAPVPLPEGPSLLEKIRPLMRRNRRGAGGSGSMSFLSRALKCGEADLLAAFSALGLVVPAAPGDKPGLVVIGPEVWWLELDQRGSIWINGRENAPDQKTESSGGTTEEGKQKTGISASPAAESLNLKSGLPTGSAPTGSVLTAVRLLLKATKTGAVAGKVDRLAEALGRTPDDLLAALTGAGLAVPEKAKEKPVFATHAGEIFWLNKNAKDELWLNAKASKYADGPGGAGNEGGRKPRRGRAGKKAD